MKPLYTTDDLRFKLKNGKFKMGQMWRIYAFLDYVDGPERDMRLTNRSPEQIALQKEIAEKYDL